MQDIHLDVHYDFAKYSLYLMRKVSSSLRSACAKLWCLAFGASAEFFGECKSTIRLIPLSVDLFFGAPLRDIIENFLYLSV